MPSLAVQPRTLPELMAASGRTNWTKFLSRVLGPLLDVLLVEAIVLDTPRSPTQQYRPSEVGRQGLRGGM